MENSFNEKESLELISRMISSAKNNLQKGTGKIFLLWGYLVAAISLLTFILQVVLPEEIRYNAFYLWFLMGAGYPFHYYFIRKRSDGMLVRTYIEKLMDWVWIAFTIAVLVFVFGMLIDTLLVAFNAPAPADRCHEFVRWFHWLLLTPVLLGFYGFALFVSGKAYEFKPLVVGGLVCFAASFFLLFTLHKTGVAGLQQFVLCVSVIAGFVVPGHMLTRKEKKDVQGS